MKAHASMCTVSDDLVESFQGQLLSGSALRTPIKKTDNIYSYIPSNVISGKFDIPMSRAYTRLSGLWASFVKEPLTDAKGTVGKELVCNNFYVHHDAVETLSYSLQLGTKRIPDNDSVGFSEIVWRLMNA
jgi:hypothetical protein